MRLTERGYREYIKRAEAKGACKRELKLIKSLTVEEFFEHESAAYWLCWYARYVIKARWLEAEEVIATDAECAHTYAKNVIKARWHEAEGVITIDPYCAYRYAKYVIKARWHEAEELIATDPFCWGLYSNFFEIIK